MRFTRAAASSSVIAIRGAITDPVGIVAANASADAAIAFHARGTCTTGWLIVRCVTSNAIVNIEDFIPCCRSFRFYPSGVADLCGIAVSVCIAFAQALVGITFTIHGLAAISAGTIGARL